MTTKPTRGPIGRFQVREQLGRGGMGVVWLCYDPQLGRDVAVKMLVEQAAEGSDRLARFLQEARLMARLDHPGIVAVHEVGDHDGVPFIVTDVLEGKPLSELLEHRWPDFKQSAELIAKLAEAAAHAHDHGVIHRDIKPENVVVESDGTPRLLDFGVAHDRDAETRLSQTGQILGSPYFLAPEQVRARLGSIGPWTDVHALGALLFELLCRVPAFDAQSLMPLLRKITVERPPAPRSIDRNIPRDLERIVLHCLEKQVEDRYQSALDLAADLRRFLAGEDVSISDVSSVGLIVRALSRRRSEVALAVTVVAALGAGMILLSGSGNREPDGRRTAPSEPAKRRDDLVATQEEEQDEEASREAALVEGAWWEPCQEQLAYARKHSLPLVLKTSRGMELVLIPPGEFRRKGTEGGRHRVTIGTGFYLGATEVTNAQYQALVPKHQVPFFEGYEPMGHEDQPVVGVTWLEVREYCRLLSSRDPEGLRCRLPTEAEWEFACRAGTDTRYYWGGDEAGLPQHENVLDSDSEAFASDGQPPKRLKFTHSDAHRGSAPVASYQPNPWGLFDMLGNVSEWCSDYHGPRGNQEVRDPQGPASGYQRVWRGGSWELGPENTGCGERNSAYEKEFKDVSLGFRVVVDLPARRQR